MHIFYDEHECHVADLGKETDPVITPVEIRRAVSEHIGDGVLPEEARLIFDALSEDPEPQRYLIVGDVETAEGRERHLFWRFEDDLVSDEAIRSEEHQSDVA